MKFEKVLEQLNSLEKNSFLKIVDNIINSEPKNFTEIDNIIKSFEGRLKDAENENIVKIFALIEDEYAEYITECFRSISSQVDILIDIIIRDGNCLLSRDWFSKLYEKEINKINKKVNEIQKAIVEENGDFEPSRLRDYQIYKSCVHTAYYNDESHNLDKKITDDEQSILNTLSKKLGLSTDEVKLLNYIIIPLEKSDIDDIIKELKDLGIIFYSRKNMQLYVPDEIVRVLRLVRGKYVADKHFRRVLKHLKDSHINLIARKHGIDRKLSIEEKINEIINEGLDFNDVLIQEIHKDDSTKTDKKNFLNNLIEKELKIDTPLKGATAEDKVENLINYFDDLDKDEKVSISVDGYEKLLQDLKKVLPDVNEIVKNEFEMQRKEVMNTSVLLDYSIKPRDILYLLSTDQLKSFCTEMSISYRGDEIKNILECYKDSENIFLENYVNVASRDIAELKLNGIAIKESELGLKFEELSGKIFEMLGFNVDFKLRDQINNSKNKVDLLINLGNEEIIIVECKTQKDKDYNKFSTVSRQIQAYMNLAEQNGYRVIKSLLIAPDFSDDFEKECGLEYELNLSLMTASTMKKILDGFKKSKHKQFPYKLLLRDILIKEDRILKALEK